MANASKHHMGAGSQGKRTGVGGMTNPQDDLIGDNEILSNRDKSRHSDERGLDGKTVQVEQMQDIAASHETAALGAGEAVGNTSGLAGPMSDESSTKSSVSGKT